MLEKLAVGNCNGLRLDLSKLHYHTYHLLVLIKPVMSVSHKGSYFHSNSDSNSDSGSDSRSKPASHVLRPARVHRQFTHPYLPVAGVQGHFDTRVSA